MGGVVGVLGENTHTHTQRKEASHVVSFISDYKYICFLNKFVAHIVATRVI